MTMKRTISGMIGAGSLAHNRRDFMGNSLLAVRDINHIYIVVEGRLSNWNYEYYAILPHQPEKEA